MILVSALFGVLLIARHRATGLWRHHLEPRLGRPLWTYNYITFMLCKALRHYLELGSMAFMVDTTCLGSFWSLLVARHRAALLG